MALVDGGEHCGDVEDGLLGAEGLVLGDVRQSVGLPPGHFFISTMGEWDGGLVGFQMLAFVSKES